VKLTPPSYLMLGMVQLGVRSGYAIKKAADASTRFFWPTSLAQVYPQLGRLQQAGLLTRREDPRGSLARSAYELTASGRAALLAWLRSPRAGETHFRDEDVLRLFNADVLPTADQLALVWRMHERATRECARMREEIVPLADMLAAEGVRNPARVARLGADTYAFVAQWLEQLAQELEAEVPG